MSANTAKRIPSMRTMRALLLRGASGGALTLLLATSPVRANLAGFNAALGHNIGAVTTAARAGAVTPTLTPTMNQIIARHTQYQQIVQQQAAIVASANSAAREAARAAAQSVPNGLVKGGLEAAVTVKVANVADIAGKGLSVWQGADLPTQSVTASTGAVDVTVNQTDSRALLSWTSFNVGRDTTLTFNQQGHSDWVAVNRVVGGIDPNTGLLDPTRAPAPSEILGKIKADGTVYVLNRSGILFGATAQVDLHSLVASSLELGKTIAPNPDKRVGQPSFVTNSVKQLNEAYLQNGILPAEHVGLLGYIDRETHGDVTVARGAQIASSGGFVIIAAPKVTMAGEINPATDASGNARTQVPGGQVSLVAGRLVDAVVATGAAGSVDPNVRGLVLASTGGGTVDVSGSINAPQGYISLVTDTKGTVNLSGILSSTTSVSRNGKISLIGGSVNMLSQPALNASGNTDIQHGTIAITADTGGDTIPQSAASIAAFKRSQIDIGNFYVQAGPVAFGQLQSVDSLVAGTLDPSLFPSLVTIGDNAMIHAPSADVNVGGTANGPRYNDTSITGISKSGITIGANAVIDVSGLDSIQLAAARNQLTIAPAKKNELRDTPTYREVRADGGFTLNGATLYVDARASSVRSDGVAWIGSPLLEAGSLAAQIGVTAPELMTRGGNVTLATLRRDNNSPKGVFPAAVNIDKSATIDFSGGWVNYGAGFIRSSRLLTADGRTVDISAANPNDRFIGIAGGFVENLPQLQNARIYNNPLTVDAVVSEAYAEGRDAGSLTVSAPTMSINGSFHGDAVAGSRQTSDGQVPTATVAADPRKLQAVFSQLPSSGFLHVDAISLGGSILYGGTAATGADGSPKVQLGQTQLDSIAGLIHIAEPTINNANLSALSLQSSGAVIFAKDSLLTLQPGGTLNVEAGRTISFNGDISVPAGTIAARTYAIQSGDIFDDSDNLRTDVALPANYLLSGPIAANCAEPDCALPAWQTLMARAGDPSIAAQAPGWFDIVVSPDASLSARGLWTNDLLVGADGFSRGGAYTSGGSVSLTVAPHVAVTTASQTRAIDISGSILLRPDSLIDVSGGGYVAPTGGLSLNGKGGNVSLIDETVYFQLMGSSPSLGNTRGNMFFPSDYIAFQLGAVNGATQFVSALVPDEIRSRVDIAQGASIRGFGFKGGGTFKLVTPDLAFNDSSGSGTQIPLDFLNRTGFGTLDLSVWKTAIFDNVFANGQTGKTALLATKMLTIGAGDTLNLTQTILPTVLTPTQSAALRAQTSDTDITRLDAITPSNGLGDYDNLAANLVLGGLTELDLLDGGNVIGAAGATITAPKLYVAGDISIRGGSITQSELLPGAYMRGNLYFSGRQSSFGVSPWSGGQPISIEAALADVFGPPDANGKYSQTASIVGDAAAKLDVRSIEKFLTENPNDHQIYALGRLAQDQGILFTATSTTDLSGGFIQNPRASVTAGGTQVATGRLIDGGTIRALGRSNAVGSIFSSASSSFGVSPYQGRTSGDADLTAQRPERRIDAETGANISLSGGSAILDLRTSGQALTPTLVGTKAGTLSGLGGGDVSGATILAKAGTANAQGGTFEWFNPVLQQNAGSGLAGAGANGTIVFADQLSSAGFDSFVARGALSTNGDVTLSLGRSFLLGSPDSLDSGDTNTFGYYASSINATGDLTIQAPHIALTSISQGFNSLPAGTGAHNLILRAEGKSGTGASFDIAGAVAFGGGLGNVALSSQGDIRLIGVQPIKNTLDPSSTVETPSLSGGILAAGNLSLQARQVYATTGTGNLLQDANASAPPFTIASLAKSIANAPTITFRTEPGTTPSKPYSAGSHILVAGESILQDGVLQAPLGRIDLGSRTGFQLTDLGKTITTETLTLTSRSVTSVSADGLNIPFGTTIDGTEYYFTPTLTSALSAAPAARLDLAAGTITTEAGATVDASGGGSIYAYEFVSGTGGSRDALSRFNSDAFSSSDGVHQYADGRQVYAILPADSPQLAALYDPIYSSDYADLYGANVGKAVHLDAVAATADRPAIAAGAYILLPAKYALLPGAMRIVENVGAAAPLTDGAVRLLDNSVLVGGVHSIAGTDIAETVRRSFTVQTKDVFTQYSRINTTDAASYFRGKAAENSFAIPRLPNDAARIVIDPGTGLSIGSRFDTDAASDEAGNKGRGSQVDIVGDIVNIVSSMDNAGSSGVNLLPDTLVNLNAESLLIGGERTDRADGSTAIAVSASEIHVRNFSSDKAIAAQAISLTAPEIILAVQGGESKLDIASNAFISATGALTDTRSGIYDLTTSDPLDATARVGTVGALLRVANGPERVVDRIGNTDSGVNKDKPAFTIGAATITGQSLTLDTSRNLDMDAANLNVQNLALSSDTVAFSKRTFGVQGFIISPELAAKLSNIARITLISPNSIGFAPAIAADGSASAYVFKDLVLDTPGLRSIHPVAGKANQGPMSVTIDASNLTLRNSFADTGLCTTIGLTGCNATGNSLTVNATGTLSLQSGTFRTYGFDKAVATSALGGTYYSGKGSLEFDKAQFTLNTPFIADLGTGTVPKEGAQQPNYEINTAGSVAINAPSASTAVAQTALLAPGARFAVHALDETAGAPGLTIADTVIRATAGTIDLQAQGDITLSGAAALEVPGYSQVFGPKSATGEADPDQVTVSASAGSVSLVSRSGNIAVVSTAASPHFAIGGASGGSGRLSLLAAQGTVDLGLDDASGFARLINAASPNRGASLAFDSGKGSFAFDAFVTALGSQFTGDIAVRSGLGDLVLGAGQTLKASSVGLTSDGGSTIINGTIDTSGINGGAISLYASDDVSLGSGAILDAHSVGYAQEDTRRAKAGDVTLGISGDGAISVAAGATIDLGINAARAGNIDGYRAVGHQQTDPVTHTQVTSYTIVEGDGGGTLTLRAPLQPSGDTVNINFGGAIAGTPSDISVVGYRRYDLETIDTTLYSGVTIVNGVATLDARAVPGKINVLADEAPGTIPDFIQNFAISDATRTAFGSLTDHGSRFHEKPGVELAYSGTITLASNWNLGAGRITDPVAALEDEYLSKSPLSEVAGVPVYSVTQGKEADLFQNYVHMLYRTGTGLNTGGEAGVFTLRAGGDLNLTHSISDGFFNFADQTDSTYLTYQLGGGTLLFNPTFTFGCGADGCSGLAAFPTDYSGKVADLPLMRESLSFGLNKAATETLVEVSAPYSDTANAAAAYSNGTVGGGDPFGGAQLFPLLTVTDDAGGRTTRAVASSDIQLVAGAGAMASANPLHIDRGAAGSVTLSGSTSYDLATSGKAKGLYFGETFLQSSDYGTLKTPIADLADFAEIVSDLLKEKGINAFPKAVDDLGDVAVRINLGSNAAPLETAQTFVDAHSTSAAMLGPVKARTGLATTLDLAIEFLTSTNAIELLGDAVVGKPITGATGGRVVDAGTVIVPSLVRTGTGRIDVAAAVDVDLRNGDTATLRNANLGKIASTSHPLYQLGGTAIYTAGHVVIPHSTTIGGVTVDPTAYLPAQYKFDTLWEPDLNGRLQANPVFATGGGAVTVEAGNDILGRRDVWNEKVNRGDSGGAHRTGGVTHNFTSADMYGAGDQRWRVGEIGSDLASTYIRINPQTFTSGIATLGGGDVSLYAGGDVRELTTALDTTLASADVSDSFGAMIFGGGDLDVFVGGQVAGGRFDISTGIASITAAENTGSSGWLNGLPNYGQATATIKNVAHRANVPEIRLTDTHLSLKAGGSITLAAVSALGTSSADLNSLGYYTGTSGVSAVSNGSFTITGGPSMPVSLASDRGNVAPVTKILPASLEVTSFGGNIDLGKLNSFLYPSATGQLSLLAGGTLADGSAINLDDGDPSLMPGLYSAFATEGNPAGIVFGRAFYLPSVLPNSSDATRRLYHYNVFAQTRDTKPVRIAVGGDLSQLTLYTPKQARVSAEGDIVNIIFVGQNLTAGDTTRIVAGRDITSTTKVSTSIVLGDTNGRILSQGNFFALGGPGSFFVEAGRDLGPFLKSATISNFGFRGGEIAKTKDGTVSFAGGILAVGNDYNPWLAPKSADIYAFFGVSKGTDFAALADTYVNPANAAALPGDLFEQNVDLFGNKSPDRTRPVYGPILVAWMKLNQAELLASLYGTIDVTVQQAYDAFAGLSELTQRRFLLDKVYFNELAAPSQPDGNSYLKYGRGYRAVETLFPSSFGYTQNDTTGTRNGTTRDGNNVPQLQHSGNLDLRLAAIQTTRDSNITLLGPGGNAILGSVIRTEAQAASRAYQPFIIGSYLFPGVAGKDAAFPVLSIPTGYEGMLTLRGGSIHSFTDGDLRLNQSRLFTQDSGDIILWSSNGDLNAGQGPKSAANVPPIVLRFNPNGGSEVDSAAGVVGAGIAAFAGIRRLERDGAALTDSDGDPDAATAREQLASLPLGTPVTVNGKIYRFALTDALNDSTVAGESAELGTLTRGTIATIGGKTYQRDLPTIYLLAPSGTIDAGDAGVRAAGDIFVAAAQVANADNFKVGGTAIGVPSSVTTPTVALPSGATSALVANVFKATANDLADQRSRITVDVEGFYSFDASCKDAQGNPSSDCTQ